MPMSDCFIGYRLRQRLNEMEKRIVDNDPCKDASPEYCMCGTPMADHTGWEGHSPVSEKENCEEKVAIDRKNRLTRQVTYTTSVCIGGDVAGPQPTGQEPKET